MGRIKTLTRPKVNQAYVHQGIVLTLLEKQLRNLLSNLGDTLSKPEEQYTSVPAPEERARR